MIALLTTACGPRVCKNRFNIGTSHKKWVNEIGLFSYKDVKVRSYEEENEITVYLEYDNYLSGYEELCTIVNNHNKFVENNPDYFKEGTKFYIINEYASEQDISIFSNFTSDDSYVLELGKDCNLKIQCMTLDLNTATCEIVKDDNIALDIPVISLGGIGSEAPDADTYEFLSEFKDAEQVILYYRDQDDNLLDFDEEQTCEYIKRVLPDVEVYNEVYDAQEKEYHLKKIQ